MKKIFLALLACTLFSSGYAQVLNHSFETWFVDTGSFEYAPLIPLSTYPCNNPVNWSSGNQLTKSPDLGGNEFVTESSDAYDGVKALRLETDSVNAAGLLTLIIPGIAITGNFDIALDDLFAGGGLSPMNLKDAGTPVNGRQRGIGMYVKYSPVPNDSFLIWAVLRKGNIKVAETKIQSSAANNNYTFVQGNFTYLTCDIPDTMVLLVSSSTPDFSSLGSGETGLNAGSVLLVDSITLLEYAGPVNLAPIAVPDQTFTFTNQSKTVTVITNDSDCENDPLTVGIATNPLHGTAVVNPDKTITYTPAQDYSGSDTLYYSLNDGNSTSTTYVVVNVFIASGVNNVNGIDFKLFPNPVNNMLTIECDNDAVVQIADITGQLITSLKTVAGKNTVDLSALAKGSYVVTYTINGTTLARRIVKL
jgi:hypothetical protein